MKIVLTSTMLAALAMTAASAQQPQMPDPAPHQEAIRKLRAMAGTWKGSGWMRTGPEKHTFQQREEISLKLSDTVLLIEGNGVNPEGKPIHQALAVVSWDTEGGGKYKFRSYAFPGLSGDFDASFGSGKFVWGMKIGPVTTRYTITISGNEWLEIGEMRRGGESAPWVQFFEMKLTKN